MKKLLSILAVVGLTATASTSVVACSSSSKDKDANENLTKTILNNSSLGDVEASDILNDILKTDQQSLIFGDKGTALKTFSNYAAESFMKNSDKLKDLSQKYIANGLKGKDINGKDVDAKDKDATVAKAKEAASYIDDGLWDNIKQDWNTRFSNAKDAWAQAIKDAKSKYGKKWESNWLKDLQSQFGDYVYVNGTRTKATKTNQYKDLYVSYSILNGESNGKTIADSLKDDIYLWGSAPTGTDVQTIKNALMTQVFTAKAFNIGGKSIDFKSNSKQLTSISDDANRGSSWLGQLDNFIDGLQASYSKADNDVSKMSNDDQIYLDDLINMINVTGGYNLEDLISTTASKDSSTPSIDRNNYLIGNAQWASRTNIFDHIKKDTSKTMSNTLMQRWDANFTEDFAGGNSGTADTSALVINSAYDVSNIVSTVYTNPGKTTTNQINGLFSNSQRYIANDYYQVEKPVAVSELVVKPLYTDGPDLDQFITNNKYVGKDANGNTGLMDSFYRFLGNFIDNTVTAPTGTDFSTANTSKVKDGTSDYSWDDLMKLGVTGVHDVTTKTTFDSKFTGDVSFTSHSNLLTRDSSSSDYSDILKYSIYDYLSNGITANNQLKLKDASSAAPGADANPENISIGTVNQDKTPDQVAAIKPEYQTITNLVDSLNRTNLDGSKSIYKVVNPQQGIIAFMDKDGIHFVRIEGYGLMDKSGAGKIDTDDLVTNPQSQLTVNDFNNKDETISNSAENSYHTAQLLASDLSADSTKTYATNITSDYMNSSDYTGGTKDAPANQKLTENQYYSGLTYNDLNKSFGNKYLRFLANSSIAKSNGISGAKYSYDLNAELKSYIGADLTADNLGDSSDMLDMIWNYMSEITGLNDDQLFTFVSTDGSATDQTKSLIFDVLRNVNLADDTKDKFIDLYKDWIESALSSNSLLNRQRKGTENFTTSWGNADKTLSKGTTWTNPDPKMAEYHPSLTFKDAEGKSDDNWYSTSAQSVDDNKVWTPFKDTIVNAPDTPDSKQANVVFSRSTSNEIKYQIKMSKFIPNDFAMKGDEE